MGEGQPVPTPPLPPTGSAARHALGGRSQGRVQCGAHSCVVRAPAGTGWDENPRSLARSPPAYPGIEQDLLAAGWKRSGLQPLDVTLVHLTQTAD